MWTSTLELSPRRALLTQLLGRFWRGAYFSSLAPLQVRNLPRQPLPAPDWVRVRNRLAGICGSDLHMVYVDADVRIAPAALPSHAHSYPGHEVVGEVIEVGDEVRRLRAGDRVVLQSGRSCLSTGAQPPCPACASGNYNLCQRTDLAGPEQFGGGWSEEMLLHERQLFRVPSELSDEQAALLEPGAVAVHAVLRRLPAPGERVLIIGAGTIGLLTLQVAHALAPHATIDVVARYAYQVEQATRMGAEHIIYNQDSYSEVQQATGARLYTGMFGNKMLLGGYDVIYDTVGTRHTIQDALRWTRAQGSIVLVGADLHTMHVDLTPVWYQEVDLVGTMGHGVEIWPIGSGQRASTFSVAADLIISGHLHPEKLITHRFPLSDFRQALTAATGKARSRAIKVVFDFSLMPASVVPHVRAARSQRTVRATSNWQQTEHTSPEEQFVPTTPVPSTPPLPSLPETPPPEPPQLPPDAESIFEDDSATVIVNRPRRPPAPLQFHKITWDIQTDEPGEADAAAASAQNEVATNTPPDTLQEIDGA